MNPIENSLFRSSQEVLRKLELTTQHATVEVPVSLIEDAMSTISSLRSYIQIVSAASGVAFDDRPIGKVEDSLGPILEQQRTDYEDSIRESNEDNFDISSQEIEEACTEDEEYDWKSPFHPVLVEPVMSPVEAAQRQKIQRSLSRAIAAGKDQRHQYMAVAGMMTANQDVFFEVKNKSQAYALLERLGYKFPKSGLGNPRPPRTEQHGTTAQGMAVAVLADGGTTADAAAHLGFSGDMRQMGPFVVKFKANIEAMKALPYGKPRTEYLQKWFGMGMPKT